MFDPFPSWEPDNELKAVAVAILVIVFIFGSFFAIAAWLS